MPILVTWKEWRGNNLRQERAYFVSEDAAKKFMDGVIKEREAVDVVFTTVPLKDVV